MTESASSITYAGERESLIQAIRQNLVERACDGYCYLSITKPTTTIAPGYDEAETVDYVFINGVTQPRLFDQNDAGHSLHEQSVELLRAILDDLQATQHPNGHVLEGEDE